MKYSENLLKVGEYVLCINDNFPIVQTTGDKSKIGKLPINHPKEGELCRVDEILGEYIRFDEYDCNDPNNPEYGFKWWKHNHFKKLSEDEFEKHYEEKARKTMLWFRSISTENKPF